MEILQHNNEDSNTPTGIYNSSPGQGITLLVDFKSSDPATLDAVVTAIQPLQDQGWLSYYDTTLNSFVENHITVVASGSAPWDRILNQDGIPDLNVFYDAHLDAWDSHFTSANCYYASADFQSDIGDPGSADEFNDDEDERSQVISEVNTAHGQSLKARYCKCSTIVKPQWP